MEKQPKEWCVWNNRLKFNFQKMQKFFFKFVFRGKSHKSQSIIKSHFKPYRLISDLWASAHTEQQCIIHHALSWRTQWYYYITVLSSVLTLQQTKQPFELLRWPGSKSTINVTEHTKRDCEVALCLSTVFPHSSMTTSKPVGFFWIHLGNTCKTVMFNT